ncbi:sigma-70 family RNA polymerase sigma factor [Paraflavitalea soli]|uniref:Sigma-70 family RNA polymerase sigma factor n=1 Tax=Paraflavitalea soli TaxID=2315862 RepID=A0A3B7MHS3_9BACT|nr:sigma-70 family RNA polymerase sigma factor [Paraflavitalea soli]AXY72853.1 sigma-70 family RNA polymerase sigma factor [Paraflavitalea soli]
MNEDEQNIQYWEQMRRGDKQALFELYNNTYFHLVRFGLKITANDELVKDCVTQLFFQLWDKHARLNAVTHVRAYLFTSLRRMLLDKLDYHSKTDAAISRLSAKEEQEELSYEEIIVRVQHDEELRQKLYKAMEQLTPKQKELIRLMFFEGLNYEQVANQTSLSIKTAYNTIYNAIQVLRKVLK